MIETLPEALLDCVLAIASGLVLVLVLRAARVVLDAIPMSRGRRALVTRIRPLAGAVLVLVYVALGARWLLERGEPQTWIAFGLALVVLAAAAWPALRDLIEGVLVRSSHTLAVGDRVQVGAVRGRVQRLGYRHVVIEATDGELAVVPYRLVATTPILRSPADERSTFHVFRIPVPAHRGIAEAKRIVREAALLCHWSSIARPPQVIATDDGELEITVFPIAPDHAAEIERVLRRALAT